MKSRAEQIVVFNFVKQFFFLTFPPPPMNNNESFIQCRKSEKISFILHNKHGTPPPLPLCLNVWMPPPLTHIDPFPCKCGAKNQTNDAKLVELLSIFKQKFEWDSTASYYGYTQSILVILHGLWHDNIKLEVEPDEIVSHVNRPFISSQSHKHCHCLVSNLEDIS